MSGTSRPESILSHGEQDVAGYLRESPGMTPAEIAEARGVPDDAVEKSIRRIEEKTRRAVFTLIQSPYTTEVVAELDPDTRRALLDRLQRDEATNGGG